MLKISKRRNQKARTALASLVARKKAGRRVGDPVVTDGVVCYYDGADNVLLIVPFDETEGGATNAISQASPRITAGGEEVSEVYQERYAGRL